VWVKLRARHPHVAAEFNGPIRVQLSDSVHHHGNAQKQTAEPAVALQSLSTPHRNYISLIQDQS